MATFNDIVYTIDLRNPSGTVLPPPSPFLSFIVPPEDSNNDSWLEGVLKINLNDPSLNNPYDTAEFQIEYDADPSGMTNVNIGDSQTNDSGGGDGGTQSNDAELNIGREEGDVKDLFIQAHDNAPSELLKSVSDFVPGQGSQINLTVKNDFLAWDNNQGISGSLSSPFLYALNGQSDSEGPINYDIFAAFNRVINGSYRLGSGVGKVTVRLIDTDTTKVGTEDPEPLNGTNTNDVIYALGGNDTVAGGLGGDRIFGGDGDDVLRGDLNTRDPQVGIGGDDFIDGGKGKDRIGGKGGKDTLYGGEEDDQIWGDDGDDLLRGGKGNDVLYGDDQSGGKGNDTLIGVEPNTVNPGQGEIDTLTGGQGDDTFVLGDANGVYYLKGDDYSSYHGFKDYALITDFKVGNDKIQLSGDLGSYRLVSSGTGFHANPQDYIPGVGDNDTLIFRGYAGDLVAVVKNISPLIVEANLVVV